MRRKISRIAWLIFGTVFILTFFTSIRIIALYYYHLQQAKGDYTLGMILIDKANIFNFTSFTIGWLWGWVIGIMILIVVDR